MLLMFDFYGVFGVIFLFSTVRQILICDHKLMGERPDDPAAISATRNGQTTVEDPITIAEITYIAKRKLPKQVWDYYASGSDEEVAVARNKTAFDRLVFSCFLSKSVLWILIYSTEVSFCDHEYYAMSRL